MGLVLKQLLEERKNKYFVFKIEGLHISLWNKWQARKYIRRALSYFPFAQGLLQRMCYCRQLPSEQKNFWTNFHTVVVFATPLQGGSVEFNTWKREKKLSNSCYLTDCYLVSLSFLLKILQTDVSETREQGVPLFMSNCILICVAQNHMTRNASYCLATVTMFPPESLMDVGQVGSYFTINHKKRVQRGKRKHRLKADSPRCDTS